MRKEGNLFIAAQTLALDMVLVTNNEREFAPVRGPRKLVGVALRLKRNWGVRGRAGTVSHLLALARS